VKEETVGGDEADRWVRGVRLAGGLHRQWEKGERGRHRFSFNPGWAEAEMFAGPDLFPGALFQFFDFFSFSVLPIL
jgi:hypothetical protein